ncbi:hypothetical protein KR222_008131, partial [Zaprionus bogoriensis]
DEQYFNETLEIILLPRWLGSFGHIEVAKFLAEELEFHKFIVKNDLESDSLSLTNVIGIMNPSASKFIMLTCHYDTKFMMELEEFVGATDGGVSCAILLAIARNLNRLLVDQFNTRSDLGLVLAFFDGHESMEGITDDTYPLLGSNEFVNKKIIHPDKLVSLAVVITLNLIGSPDHIYMSKYEATYKLHETLADIEQKLRLEGQLSGTHQLFYKLKDHYTDSEDDHIPFLEAGVRVMHIVPHTYPEVWRRLEDDIKHLHWPSVRNMNLILTRFVYTCLQ